MRYNRRMSELLTPEAVAELLTVPEKTLAQWRYLAEARRTPVSAVMSATGDLTSTPGSRSKPSLPGGGIALSSRTRESPGDYSRAPRDPDAWRQSNQCRGYIVSGRLFAELQLPVPGHDQPPIDEVVIPMLIGVR